MTLFDYYYLNCPAIFHCDLKASIGFCFLGSGFGVDLGKIPPGPAKYSDLSSLSYFNEGFYGFFDRSPKPVGED